MHTDGGYWTVFQRRLNGKTGFYRGWNEYKNGFGDPSAEYWLGNDKIHRLTLSGQSLLRIDLGDFKGGTAYAKYLHFSIGDSSSKYKLTVFGYSGTAGDSLSKHHTMMFSTMDNDNDRYSKNCATEFNGSWWYNMCCRSNLNGQFKVAGIKGISWYTWRGYGSIKTSTMMIRKRTM
ncbi:Hypothetical predicted protein [Mytilus galloprovincialis]|uniref:Fibrinogen C-terminal domain-containing protein n=1 Tax=Mytilus galloprovincialis TaxID=29158 RepID=A0A8B6H6Q7_MYTGA|nr:Hypothetical predicted protein [Mytilus galloprovincialis]